MNQIQKIFGSEKALIGMVHVQALPGTPRNKISINQIVDKAVEEAITYEKNGLSGIIIENMHDVPYINKKVGPEITASMTTIASAIKTNTSFPCGIQILAGANKEALAVALACNLDFLRVEGFVYSHVADEGFMDSCASELMRYRKSIGASEIAIFTDIKKKHGSHKITEDISIAETAKAAEFFLSDGLIITGTSTSKPTLLKDIKDAKNSTKLPILVGSGVTAENVNNYYELADALIIGSYFKENGYWENPISIERIKNLLGKINK